MNNYFDTDKYFDFDSEKKSEAKAKKRKKQQQQAILLLLLMAGAAYYYFMVYLPDEERKKLEAEIQKDLNEVKELKKNDYENITKSLIVCQKYLKWNKGTKIQQIALKNKENELNNAIQWLKQNQLTPEKAELEAFKKGRIWELPVKSWADVEVRKMASVLLGKYQEEVKTFPGGDKNDKFCFTRGASYNIYFPPDLKDCYEAGKKVNQTNCFMLEEKEDLILSDEINAWIRKVVIDPIRMTPSSKRDNNAIFYGAPGTGKTATLKNICIESNKYPLIEIKGSALTPRDKDQKAGILVLEKFCYTISELEWKLVKTYGLERETNGEVRYILFVDEADQISNNSLIHEPNRLRFLKECLEGVGKNQRSNNLWVFATNHLKDIEEAVYRKGRLSNPLDFSWTWGEFRKYFNDFVSNPGKYDVNFNYSVPPLPDRWCKEATLKPEDDKHVKRFNIDTFKKDFFGEDDDNPAKPKFWKLFIENNPDAILKTEIMKLDEEGKETNEVERIDETEIEIGEFLQFFWNLKDGGQLMNYDGNFENPRTPKVEEVLDDSLPDVADLLLQSSNNLSKSLENLRQEIGRIGAEIECARINQDDSINSNINELFKLVGELRAKIE